MDLSTRMKMKTPSPSIRLAFMIADTHCGSTQGILPPGFVTHEGNEIRQNEIQRWLWDCWQRGMEWMEKVADGDPYALILNGDCLDGNHHRTKEIWSPDEGDHLKCARELLKVPAGLAAKVFVVAGTEVHTHNAESALAEMLSAVPDPNTGKGAWHRADLTIAGTRLIAQHHCPTSQRSWTAASALCAGLAEEQLQAARNGEQIPLALATAHRHVFGTYESPNGVAVGLPAWQGLTRFGQKVVPSARTQCGLVAFDWREREDGMPPEVKAATYIMPRAKGAVV
jgi:hypothetical protein